MTHLSRHMGTKPTVVGPLGKACGFKENYRLCSSGLEHWVLVPVVPGVQAAEPGA